MLALLLPSRTRNHYRCFEVVGIPEYLLEVGVCGHADKLNRVLGMSQVRVSVEQWASCGSCCRWQSGEGAAGWRLFGRAGMEVAAVRHGPCGYLIPALFPQLTEAVSSSVSGLSSRFKYLPCSLAFEGSVPKCHHAARTFLAWKRSSLEASTRCIVT